MTTRSARFAQVLLWVVPALWSSNYIIARLAPGVIAPHALALGRWTLALALMLPFVWRELRDIVWKKYQRKRIPWERVAELDRILGDEPPAKQ